MDIRQYSFSRVTFLYKIAFKIKKMNFKVLTIIFLLIISNFSFGQNNFSESPLNAVFETRDFTNFWRAFDKMETSKENPFKEYLQNGSVGLKAFPYRVMSADSLYAHVKRKKSEYEITRNIINDIPSKEKRLRAIYSALKYWYPEAKFPPIYLVYGLGYSGGTSTNDGLIIGTEVIKNLDGLPALAAHELIHFQQNVEGEQTLLKQSLLEGGADFIGELISGENINSARFQYGDKHLDKLCKEFVSRLKSEDTQDWLYQTSKKDDRPNDLGYWMGYKIVEAYFNKQEDKKKAIDDILHIKDPMQFLKESGFLSSYIESYQKSKNEDSDKFYQIFSDEVYKVSITVKVPHKEDEIYITGNQEELGKWIPNKIKLNKKSDYERIITLKLHTPAKFKFTKGSWENQAEVSGIEKGSNISLEALKPNTKVKYEIINWF